MKKILVADWLDKYGGAERVLSVLNSCFDFDKCYTLLNIMPETDQCKVFQNKKVPITESPLRVKGGIISCGLLAPSTSAGIGTSAGPSSTVQAKSS